MEADTDSSDPDTHKTEGYKYGRREIKGTRYQEAIDGSQELSGLNRINLTWDELSGRYGYAKVEEYFSVTHERVLWEGGFDSGQATGPGEKGEFVELKVTLYKRNVPWVLNEDESNNKVRDQSQWRVYVGEGCMVLSELFRRLKVGYYTSEILHALYTEYYPLHTLSFCYVSHIVNTNTARFIERLYLLKDYPLDTSCGAEKSEVTQIREWEYGTREYKALLGTRIGSIVATLVLGAFPRGTRRITYIYTSLIPSYRYGANEFYTLNMGFDITPMQNGVPVNQGSSNVGPWMRQW